MRLQHSRSPVLLLLAVLPLALAACGPQGPSEAEPSASEGAPLSMRTGPEEEAPGRLSATALPSYSLSVPRSVEVVRGTSETLTVNIVRQNGFTGAVALSMDFAVGFSATFSPSTVSALGTSSTLTLSVASRVSPGTYNVTLRGISGSLERTAVLQVIVPVPTFNLILKQNVGTMPEPFPVKQNRTGEFLVEVQPLNGFTAPVSLSVTGLPTGVFVRQEPFVGLLTRVLLVVENFSAPGSYSLSVRGEGGGQVKLASLTLEVTSNPLEVDADSIGQGQLSGPFGLNLPGIALSQRGGVPRTSLAPLPDGSILTASGPLLSRFSAEGILDRPFERDTFSGLGNNGEPIHDVLVRADGRIVTVGTIEIFDPFSNSTFITLNAMSLTPSGELDTTFGVNGQFKLDNVSGFTLLPLEWDRTLIGGVAGTSVLVMRLTPGGNLDPDFNGDGNIDGKVAISFGTNIAAGTLDMAMDSAGRFLVSCIAGGKYALARLNPNGSIDPTFGVGGRLVTNITAASSSDPVQIELDAQGRIVLAGTITAPNFTRDFVVARFLPNGGVDTSFGQGGMVSVDFAGSRDVVAALALQPDGKVLVGGSATNPNDNDGTDEFALARLASDGSLDLSFGQGGKVIIGLHDSAGIFGGLQPYSDRITELLVQPDGSILAAGRTGPNGQTFTALMRFTP